jgi:small subunit ribosomal protein S8
VSMSDPIADFLTRIRNACKARHQTVDIPASRFKREIARILKEEGYVADVEFLDDTVQGIVRIHLKYDAAEQPVISGLRRISTPGRRVYTKRDAIPRVLGGLGIAVLSTSKGVLTDSEARRLRTGGEVLCHIW